MDVVNDEEGFVAVAPYKTKDLLISEAWGASAGGVVKMEGVREAKGVTKGRAEEGGVVLDGVIEGGLVVKELLALGWRHCNSFSTNIASWNKWLMVLYSL
jgi:hypothetical protein